MKVLISIAIQASPYRLSVAQDYMNDPEWENARRMTHYISNSGFELTKIMRKDLGIDLYPATRPVNHNGIGFMMFGRNGQTFYFHGKVAEFKNWRTRFYREGQHVKIIGK